MPGPRGSCVQEPDLVRRVGSAHAVIKVDQDLSIVPDFLNRPMMVRLRILAGRVAHDLAHLSEERVGHEDAVSVLELCHLWCLLIRQAACCGLRSGCSAWLTCCQGEAVELTGVEPVCAAGPRAVFRQRRSRP